MKKAALIFIALSSPVMLVTFFIPHEAGGVVFSILTAAFPIALIIVGASRKGSLGPLKLPLLIFFLLLEGCMIAMLVLRGQVLNSPWIGGFPAAAAIQIYGMWLIPLALVSLAYGLTFDSFSLREEDLAELEKFKKKSVHSIGGEGI
ncbi:hypothetical protein ACFL20_12055 [Spirochaetota bacterium]